MRDHRVYLVARIVAFAMAIRSAGGVAMADAMNAFVCEPHNDLLGDPSANEAYCFAEPGNQYAVHFPDGGLTGL